MNKYDCDILKTINKYSYTSQRGLSQISGHSLGVVNNSLNRLISDGYLDKEYHLTSISKDKIKKGYPRNAIILAAGYGMRMVPINALCPKGLLEVNKEPLVERLIKQLHEVGIYDIIMVVGYMKENFEYLIDSYGIKMIVNPDYAIKNNLSSLVLVSDHIANTYIVPSDIWCKNNPFDTVEMYSWYMISEEQDRESEVRINRKGELVETTGNVVGNKLIGISYILEEDGFKIKDKLIKLSRDEVNNDAFWECALYENKKMDILAKVVHPGDVVEINTYEQLRELDGESENLKSDSIDIICRVLNCKKNDVVNISILKKGMTNRSFLFYVDNKKYIMRIPGEGTNYLINRKEEVDVYNAIALLGICSNPIYINPDNGYKITDFIADARVCNAEDKRDVEKCMKLLRTFHSQKIKVKHTFDIFEHILFYEKLWNGKKSAFRDYEKTKENVFSLKRFIDKQPKEWCLTHIDAVADNFLFYPSQKGESIQLIDWEYAAMQDPHVDLAMFSIYSFYTKDQIDDLIMLYFGSQQGHEIMAKIYCYVSACGLLWSNWAEYKSSLGIEFAEYGLKQYRYAKDFYKYAIEEMNISGYSEEGET